MSGKAIILLVTGVIIITGMIMFNVEAASTRIVKNFSDYYMRQNTQNIAQSGANLAIMQVRKNRDWRDGYTNLKLLDGVANVRVTQMVFDGIPAIQVFSVGTTDYGNNHLRRDTSVAYLYWTVKQYPVEVRGLLTLNGNGNAGGNSTIDGRDHTEGGVLVAASGVPAVYSTAASFTQGANSALLGGTDLLIDYAPTNPYNPNAVKLDQTFPKGFPETPDAVFGGADYNYPEGTLKAMAQSKIAGSQYVTDTKNLKYPLMGVTYVEMPTGSPVWNAAELTGSGILVVHNASKTASLASAKSAFKGLIITDDISNFHGNLLGGLVALKNVYSGNVVGNGGTTMLFSRKTLENVAAFLETKGAPAVFAWWE